MSDEMKPRFCHDCDWNSCIFLGQYGKYDLYVCPNGGLAGRETFIGRYGEDGDYQSGAPFVGKIDSITEAHRRHELMLGGAA